MWAVVLPLDVAKTRLQVAVPGSAWDVGVAQHMGMWVAWEWASRHLR
ncbi:mitochondrial arginine transporter [Haematococcus lacustris]|uniref:Mitochondrial arginine transporter n=1 Tax=Haematococcus lacustris TaxID=44745 RepID=A0A699ZVA4_HAELA|nr:mitochondrial arginine transporter [Haematococcus lacustris]